MDCSRPLREPPGGFAVACRLSQQILGIDFCGAWSNRRMAPSRSPRAHNISRRPARPRPSAGRQQPLHRSAYRRLLGPSHLGELDFGFIALGSGRTGSRSIAAAVSWSCRPAAVAPSAVLTCFRERRPDHPGGSNPGRRQVCIGEAGRRRELANNPPLRHLARV